MHHHKMFAFTNTFLYVFSASEKEEEKLFHLESVAMCEKSEKSSSSETGEKNA